MVFELVGSRRAKKEKGKEGRRETERERVVGEIEHGGKERDR